MGLLKTCEDCEHFEFVDKKRYIAEGLCGKHGIKYPLKRTLWAKEGYQYIHWEPFKKVPLWCDGPKGAPFDNIAEIQQDLAHLRTWVDSSIDDKRKEDEIKQWLYRILKKTEKLAKEVRSRWDK